MIPPYVTFINARNETLKNKESLHIGMIMVLTATRRADRSLLSGPDPKPQSCLSWLQRRGTKEGLGHSRMALGLGAPPAPWKAGPRGA